MAVEINSESVFKYFDGIHDWERAWNLHSVCIARCIWHVKHFTRLHTYGNKKSSCKYCNLVNIFMSILESRNQLEVLKLVERQKHSVSRNNHKRFTDKTIKQIIYITKNF